MHTKSCTSLWELHLVMLQQNDTEPPKICTGRRICHAECTNQDSVSGFHETATGDLIDLHCSAHHGLAPQPSLPRVQNKRSSNIRRNDQKLATTSAKRKQHTCSLHPEPSSTEIRSRVGCSRSRRASCSVCRAANFTG
jgi:hypothetical protein